MRWAILSRVLMPIFTKPGMAGLVRRKAIPKLFEIVNMLIKIGLAQNYDFFGCYKLERHFF